MNNGIFFKKSNKLWLWKAVSYPEGKLLDWEVGNRDAKTLRRLYERIEKRFAPNAYCVDDYQAYQKIIPEEKLIIGKAGTWSVENNNSNSRHWFKRFTRKSKVVSHAKHMVELTLKLQAFLTFIWFHY